MNNELQQTTSNLNLFFDNLPVRVVLDENNMPWWVAKDVCDILSLENVTNAVARVPEHHLTLIRLMSGGQMREMKAVDEPGLYRLVLRSDKPQAEPFMEWVTSEVLPSIRKTGGYVMPGLGASHIDAMVGQVINMVVPTVISQVMGQIIPMFERLTQKVDNVQINFSHYGTVVSFTHSCCEEGGYNTVTPKDDLYNAYVEYCQALNCRPETKAGFCGKMYKGVTQATSGTITVNRKRVPIIRGIALLPGYEAIVSDLQRKKEEKAAQELADRRRFYFGVGEEDTRAEEVL